VKYVYGVTSRSARVPPDVQTVVHGDVAAVTSDVDTRDLRARRRDLLHHADVLQRVFEHSAVVPLRFGVVVDDVVGDFLEPRHHELAALLRELDGAVELTVRAVFREDDLLGSLLAADARLAKLRETAPAVQLGEAVAHAIAGRRLADAEAIADTLGRHARATAVDELRTELDVFRGAFLVDRARLKAFDSEVERVARAQAGTTTFKVTGPLPPHHFVELAEAA